MWTLSDEALLAGLGSGDPEVAAAFVNRYQRRVFGMSLSILRDRLAAEEAAQEAFVRLVERPPQDRHVRAWLFAVATNVVRDNARSRARWITLLAGSPDRRTSPASWRRANSS